jgi:hypothetical protein
MDIFSINKMYLMIKYKGGGGGKIKVNQKKFEKKVSKENLEKKKVGHRKPTLF